MIARVAESPRLHVSNITRLLVSSLIFHLSTFYLLSFSILSFIFNCLSSFNVISITRLLELSFSIVIIIIIVIDQYYEYCDYHVG